MLAKNGRWMVEFEKPVGPSFVLELSSRRVEFLDDSSEEHPPPLTASKMAGRGGCFTALFHGSESGGRLETGCRVTAADSDAVRAPPLLGQRKRVSERGQASGGHASSSPSKILRSRIPAFPHPFSLSNPRLPDEERDSTPVNLLPKRFRSLRVHGSTIGGSAASPHHEHGTDDFSLRN